jgi:hypothetical protein
MSASFQRSPVGSSPGLQTPIAAFETTAAGPLKFKSTLPEDGSDTYEDLEVTTRAESASADRQRQEEAVVCSMGKDS